MSMKEAVVSKHYTVNDGKWRHIALSMIPAGQDKFDISMYVDGRKETEFSSNNISTISSEPSDLEVGGGGFTGLIDDLRIYSSKLNDGEISMIMQEKVSDDLVITGDSYSLSVWLQTSSLPESNRINFFHGRYFWRDWSAEFLIDSWPHGTRKTGTPHFNNLDERLSDFFEEPIEFYVIANKSAPEDYIGYGFSSLTDSNGFYGRSFSRDKNVNNSSNPVILQNEDDGIAEDFDFLGSLNESPSSYAGSYGTTFKKYGQHEQGHTIAIGSLAFNPNGFAPGLYYLRAAGHGKNTLWLDLNQDANFELPSERIIAAGSGNADKIIFLGHQIPLIVTPGIENDRGLAISGKRSISKLGSKRK